MLGTKLKMLRGKRRQEDVAKSLGIGRTTYAMYEQGNRNPDPEQLKNIADFYGVSVDLLLGKETPISDFDLQVLLTALKQRKAHWGGQELSDEEQDVLAGIIEAVQQKRMHT